VCRSLPMLFSDHCATSFWATYSICCTRCEKVTKHPNWNFYAFLVIVFMDEWFGVYCRVFKLKSVLHYLLGLVYLDFPIYLRLNLCITTINNLLYHVIINNIKVIIIFLIHLSKMHIFNTLQYLFYPYLPILTCYPYLPILTVKEWQLGERWISLCTLEMLAVER
jgi:hypothetical protein